MADGAAGVVINEKDYLLSFLHLQLFFEFRRTSWRPLTPFIKEYDS
jgi:hypothetical protein